MRVRVEKVGEGVRPHEIIVSIETLEGPQELMLDERSLQDNSVEIGFPIAQHDKLRLIELPAETAAGTWRVWVQESSLMPTGPHREAAE